MAGLLGAVAHDLGQSLPNTFHRTAGNAYEAVAGENGALTGKGLKSVAKASAGLLGILNFGVTMPGLAVAGLLNGGYNLVSGTGGFREGATQPTKRAVNHVKDGFSGTGKATGQLVKGAGKALAGVLTAPVDVAFGRTRTTTTLQPDYNKSPTYTNYVTTPAPSSSTPSDAPTPKNDNPTPIPAPTPNGGGTPPSSPETPPKTSKELEKEAKKAEEEKKKAEEKSAKEDASKTNEDIKKRSENYNKSIDKTSLSLTGAGGIQELVNSDSTEIDKQTLIDGITTKRDLFNTDVKTLRNSIKTEIDSDLLYEKSTYNLVLNGGTPPVNRIENIDKLKLTIENSITLVERMIDADIGGISEFEKVKGYENLSDALSELRSKKIIIERVESKALTDNHTPQELASIINIAQDFKKYNSGIDTIIRTRSDKINKELDDARKISPSDIIKQKTNINSKIDKLNTLLSNSKNKVITKKGGFFSGNQILLNKDEITDLSEDTNEIITELESLLTSSDKQIERKDVIKKIKPLFTKINESIQSLAA